MLAAAVSPDLDAIDVLLPQTQCQRCGYADCRTYASRDARRPDQPLPARRQSHPRCTGRLAAQRDAILSLTTLMPMRRIVALIDEAACIGCAACLPVCARPRHRRRLKTDAHGDRSRLHRLRALHHRACPVGCIALIPAVTPANRVHDTLRPPASNQ